MEVVRQLPEGWLEVRISSVLVVVAVLGMLVPTGPVEARPMAASITTSQADEAIFVELINRHRAANGLNRLRVEAELTEASRRWSGVMASDGVLRHAPDLSTGVSANWEVLGENVGVHVVHDLDALFRAFVDSPSHHANLVDPRFDAVGVGVVHADGKVWTTHRFMAVRGEPAATSVPPPPTTAPPTTAPPTTRAPTTAPPTTAPPTTAPPTTAPPTTAPPSTGTPTTGAPTTAPSTPPSPTTASPTAVPPLGASRSAETAAGSAPPRPASVSRPVAPPEPSTDSGAGSPIIDPLDHALLRAVLIDLARSGI